MLPGACAVPVYRSVHISPVAIPTEETVSITTCNCLLALQRWEGELHPTATVNCLYISRQGWATLKCPTLLTGPCFVPAVSLEAQQKWHTLATLLSNIPSLCPLLFLKLLIHTLLSLEGDDIDVLFRAEPSTVAYSPPFESQ